MRQLLQDMVGQLRETSSGNAKLGFKTRWGVACNGDHGETVCMAREDSTRVSVCEELGAVYFVRNEGLILKGRSGAPRLAHDTCLRSKLGLTWV